MAEVIQNKAIRKELLNVEVTRVTYSNKSEKEPFSIFKVKGMEGRIKGPWLAREGEVLDLKVRHQLDPKWGENWIIEHVVPAVRVKTAAGTAQWLALHVKGLGDKKASMLVARFGSQLDRIVLTDPKQLKAVAGVGPKLVEKLVTAFQQEHSHRDEMEILLSHGITPNKANRLIKHYKGKSLDVIRENAYLTIAVAGIGFKHADQIARSFGMKMDSPYRLAAGLMFVLEEAKNQGNCGLTRERLIKGARRVLTVDAATPSAACLDIVLDECVANKRLIEAPVGHLGGELCYFLPYLAELEKVMARELHRLATAQLPSVALFTPAFFKDLFEWAAKTKDALTDEQQQAVRFALLNPVSILTGGPGVGKSATLRVILEGLKRNQETIMMMALAGKAAQRMTSATGYPADTIHSTIGLKVESNQAPEFHSDNPLPCDTMGIDEFSMLDLETAVPALLALPTGCRLIVIGDVDQLASVGPGKLLHDLIESDCFPVTRLTQFFRFGKGSGIKAAAHAVNKGYLPEWEDAADADSRLIEVEPENLSDMVVERVRHYLNEGYKLTDIQILAPIYKGNAGIDLINQKLLSAFRPSGVKTIQMDGRSIAVGDSVLWTKTDRMAMIDGQLKKLVNGDVGILVSFELKDKVQTATFRLTDGKTAVVNVKDLFTKTVPAGAMSTHKSQGSQWPVVLQIVTTPHQHMLTRNLVYTGMTRAQERMEIIGDSKALLVAAKTPDASERCSRLMDELHAVFEKHVF